MAEGTEVAKAFVTIIPSMRGAQGAITSAMVPASNKAGLAAGAATGGSMLSTFTGFAKKAAGVFGVVGLAAGVAGFVKSSVQAGQEFDSAMSQVAATMGTTVDQIGDLRAFAQEMGETTAFSATQAAEALNYMALAGYDAQTSMDMLPTVLNLAAAGSMDLARASDMVTDTQSALGLSIEETTELVDKMAAAASTTNTSVEQLGDAMLTIGGTARDMAGGTTELAQVLGLLADNGIKGAQGGTALRNIMTSFANGKFDKAFGDLGVAAYDAEGNMRPLKDIIGDMNTAMADMSTEEKNNLIAKAFNPRDLKSINALLGTSAERWDEVWAAVDDSGGAAAAMAETQLDNLEGDLTLFQSALEGAQIAFSDLLNPLLRGITQLGTSGLSALTDVFRSEALASGLERIGNNFKPIFDALRTAGEQLAPIFQGLASSILGALGSVLEFLGNAIGPVIANLIPGITMFVGFVANGLSIMFTLIKAFFDWVNWNIMPIARQLYEQAQPYLEAIVSFVLEHLPQAKEVVDTALLGIKTAFAVVWPVVVGIVTGAIDAIKRVIGTISTIVTTVQGIFNRVKDAITHPIETARQTIKSIVDKIKSIFSGLKLELPHPKLPHLNVSGGKAPWGIGGMGEVPKFSIEWYASGGIFNAPSIIGVGEAGPEAVLPLSRLDDFFEVEGGDTFNLYINGAQVNSDEAIESRFYSLLTNLQAKYRLARG